jgi:hypothetical protein
LNVVLGAIEVSFFLVYRRISLIIELLCHLFSECLICSVLLLVFRVSSFPEEVSVSRGNADEVREASQDDDGGQELSEDVVLLLELEITRLGSSPSVVDVFLLVDPHEVDDSPSSNEGSGDHDEDATTGESASVANVIFAEPNNKEGSTSVGGQVEDHIDEWVPPLDLVVEHEEELLGDLNSDQNNSDDSNESNTSLQRNNEAADLFLGVLIRAIANTAAALRVDVFCGFWFEFVKIILLFHWILDCEQGCSFFILVFILFLSLGLILFRRIFI